MKGFLFILAHALLLSSAVQAATYSVQIGAYKDPAAADTARAADIGEISMRAGKDGLTRIGVGHFETARQAQATLQRLRDAGYADAFVSDDSGRPVTAPQSMQQAARRSPTSVEQRLNAARAKVAPEQHHNIVYLDGRLMLKEGNSFRPLE